MVAHRVAVVVLTVGFAYLSGGENGAKHKKAICNLSLTIKGITFSCSAPFSPPLRYTNPTGHRNLSLTIKGMSRGYIRLMKSPDSISGPWKMNS